MKQLDEQERKALNETIREATGIKGGVRINRKTLTDHASYELKILATVRAKALTSAVENMWTPNPDAIAYEFGRGAKYKRADAAMAKKISGLIGQIEKLTTLAKKIGK